MGGIFGGGSHGNANNRPQYTGLQTQTSASGLPVTFGWGKNRVPPNLIWYNDFAAIPHSQKTGGKGGGGGCFPAGTLVATPDGPRKIESLERGARIWCFNAEGQAVVGRVFQTHVHDDHPLIRTTLRGRRDFVVTANHWLWLGPPSLTLPLKGGGMGGGEEEGPPADFKAAGEFRVGEFLIGDQGERHEILSIEPAGRATVHNLTVEPHHTFIADGIRVHNGGGGKSNTSYTYQAAVILAIGQGAIQGIGQVWVDRNTLSSLAALGLTLFTGSPTQTPWGYLVSKHPDQALAYARLAYLASSAYDLGSSANLPNHNFEVVWRLSGTMPNTPDANFGDIIPDFLTNTDYGLGLGSAQLGDFSLYKSYCQAAGIFVSPLLDSQEQVTTTLTRWAQLSNSWIFWSGNVIKAVPLGDTAITANNVTYTPNLTPVFDLTRDDFVSEKASVPIQVSRGDPADAYNQTRIEIKNRAKNYNSDPIEYKDQSLIDQFGTISAPTIQAHEIADAKVGASVVALIGQRYANIRNTYAFKLSWAYAVLEPGDIVTISDPDIGLTKFPVRIQSYDEDDKGILSFTAEEFPAGIGTAVPISPQAPSSFPINTLAAPGNVNPPMILEPPPAAVPLGVPVVWIGASGGANWGGADVYLSFDNVTFTMIGTIDQPIAQGTVTADLPVHADPDTTDTLAVDLTASLQTLPPSATHADADADRTLCLVTPAFATVVPGNGELVAYGAAAQGTSAYAFNLTYLRRGQYGTAIADHPSGTFFSRINLADGSIFQYQLPQAYVGVTLYLKFASFNKFGQALQDISTVATYTYAPVGTAYAIAAPTNPVLTPSTTTQPDGTVVQSITLTWTASTGPLLGSYDIQWSTDGGVTWPGSGGASAASTSFIVAPAIANTNYTARLRARSQNGVAVSVWATTAATGSGSGSGKVLNAIRFWGNLAGPPTDTQELFNVEATVAFTLPQNLPTSRGGCEVAPTGAVTCAILKNGVSIGTMNIAAGATTATFTFASVASFAVGDLFKFTAPHPTDATLSGLFYSFEGTT